MPPMSRSQEDFIFDFDEDADASNPKDCEAAMSGFFAVTGQKTMSIPSPQLFKAKEAAASLPVNVPDWSRILQRGRRESAEEGRHHEEYEVDHSEVGEEDGDDDGIRVPPHEYLARRRGASFSVHEGIGGTLKGRDLRRVRNAIWKKLGIED